MALSQTALFGMVEEKLSWLSQRQRVIAQNVANADTPNYRPRDLEEIDFRQALRDQSSDFRMATTNAGHVRASNESSAFRSGQAKRTYETSPDGNAVVLEEQMMTLNQTRGDHQMMTTIYRKYHNLYRTAIGRGGGQGG